MEDPKALELQPLQGLSEVVDHEVVHELGHQADSSQAQYVLVLRLLDDVLGKQDYQHDNLVVDVLVLNYALDLFQELDDALAHSHVVDSVLLQERRLKGFLLVVHY